MQMLPVSGLFRRAIFLLSTSVMVVISPSISSRLPPTVILAMRKGTMTFISGNDDIVVYLQPIRAQNTSPIHDASSAAGLQTTPSPSQCDGAQVPLLGLPSRKTIHGNSEYVTACGIAPSNTRNAIMAYISSTVPLNEQPHRMASDYPLQDYRLIFPHFWVVFYSHDRPKGTQCHRTYAQVLLVRGLLIPS